jgi:HlyD family secretion protein
MNVITSRLPLGTARTRLPGLLGRIGPLNAVLGAALIGAGIASYFVVAGTSTPTAAVRTAAATRGVVLSTTSATGTLQAAQELSVGFTTSGTVTAVLVKPGEHVKKGQALGRIDSTSADQALKQAQASLANAQASYEQTLTGETAAERKQDAISTMQARQSLANAKTSQAQDAKQSAASVAQAKRALAVDQGQEKLDLYQQTKDQATFPNADAAQAAITADQAQIVSDQAKQQQDQQTQYTYQAEQTTDNNQLSADKQSLSNAQTAKDSAAITKYTNAVANDNGALANDSNLLNGIQKTLSADSYAISQDNSKLSTDQSTLSALENDTKTIRSDESKIAADRQSLASAQLSASSTAMRDAQSISSSKMSLQSTMASIAVKQAPPTAAALSAAKSTLLNAQIGLANARTAFDQTTLRAPIAGTVAAVNGTVGTVESGGGSSAVSTSTSSGSGSGSGSSSSSGFVTLTGLTGMQLVAGFAETDTAKLRVGQAATVTVDALPSVELAAHVIAIAGTSTTSSSVVTYNVTFALDRSEPGLKPGMTADVDVVIGEADNVVHVPTAAVNGSGSNASVTVLENGKQVRVPVVAGLQGDSSTAILSGLKANQMVVLPSVSLSSGTTGTTGSTGSTTGGRGGRLGGGGAAFFGGGFGG